MSQSQSVTINESLREAATKIGAEDARFLLLHVLGVAPAWLFGHGSDPMPAQAAALFETVVARRLAGEPVAYIEGRRGFWSLELEVTPDTLIPRAETELLVEALLDRLPADATLNVIDLGTGSGTIALSLAHARPAWSVHATDRSEGALAVAHRNAERLGLQNVIFHAGDWFAPVAGQVFDAIVSNPPYIRDDDPHLMRGDLRFEPRSALASGADGLADIRRIVQAAPAHLQPGAPLLIEHGFDQGPALQTLMRSVGFVEVETLQDLEMRDRATLGWQPPR